MRKINYQLIVSDFDGTMADNQQQVPQNNREKICEYVQNGGIFAICTGRMLKSILPIAQNLGLKGYVVAYQGTVIADIESGEIIKKGGLNQESAINVCKFLESIGQPVNLYANEILYTNMNENDALLKFYEKVTNVKAVCFQEHPSTFIKKNELNCQKITCLIDPQKRNNLFHTLFDHFGGKGIDITCSAAPLVEISPMEDSKGNALKFLAEYYQIPMEKTLAIGDNLNDISMIEVAGKGVAVENAEALLKEKADFISVSNIKGSVAQVIDLFGFENE